MHERSLSLSEAQQTLASFTEQFSEECSTIIITNDNRPILSVMPYAAHQALLANIESLQTLLEIMGGKEALNAARHTKAHIKCEHRISWEEFQTEVGWE